MQRVLAVLIILTLGSNAFAAHAHAAGVSLGYFTPQPEANASMITFSNGFSIDTRSGEPSLPERYRLSEPEPGSIYRIIQFSGPIRQEWLRELDRRGIATFGYLPHYAVLARLDQAGVDAAKSLPEVVWVGVFQPAYKIEGQLLDAKGVLKIAIALMPNEKADKVRALIAARGSLDGASESDFGTAIYATVDDATVLELARMQEVIWIQLRTEPTLCNNNGQWVTQTGWRSSAPPDTSTPARRVWAQGVRGQRVILGVTDTGLNVYSPGHDAFRDSNYVYSSAAVIPEHRKVVAYKVNRCNAGTATFGEYTYHGSHVNGTVAGDDAYNGGTSYYDGMAIKARLYFVDVENGSGTFCLDNDLTELWDTVYSGRGLPDSLRPIKQTSSSWGWGNSSGTYLLQDASTDQFCWAHKDFANLLAAGNESNTQTIRNPGIAKNVITVGATQNGTSSDAIASFSSRGPTQDGRMKPTLCDPGQDVYSCQPSPSTNGYQSLNGTSMATPMMNGSIGLIRCYLKQGYYPSGAAVTSDTFGYISAALIRSLAIVSADPNVGSYVVPSNDIGWGRIDLDSVLYFTGDKRKLQLLDDTTGVATGEYAEASFHVDSSTIPLRIALVWTDTAAATNANPTLVNNLNLEVVAPSGTFYRGNKYTSGQSTQNPSGWDSLNPEECVRVNSPETGDWTIRARGQQVRTSRQPYAWAITGAVSGPGSPANGDVGCTRIIAPAGSVDSGASVTPACSTYNYGTITVSYTVRMKIGAGYDQTADVIGQAPGVRTYVTFPSWTASPRGSVAVTCSTELAADTNHGNDRQTGTVQVNVHDVGCSHLLAPTGTVDSNSTVTPACSLYNYGTGAESYVVRMRVGAFYNQTASVTSHGAGTRIYVTFPAWSVQQARGSYQVRCSTELTADVIHANDRQSGTVTVSVHDVGCTRLLAPAGNVDSTSSVTPACSLYNYGTGAESYVVRMRVGAFYNQTASVTSHGAGTRIYVTFPAWSVQQARGTYAVRCSTELTADFDHTNDKQSGTVQVNVRDVGCSHLLAPAGNVDSGTSVTPACSTYNYGTTTASYTVRMKIGAGYNQTASVSNQTPGTRTYVTFPSWIASPRGLIAVSCSTELAGDANPADDIQTGTVQVNVHDVGCSHLLAPTNRADSGTSVTPACSLYNYGTGAENYLVRMRIGAFYDQTASVTSHGAGTRVYVTFPAWSVLQARGAYAVVCTTELATDANPANDRQGGMVQVNVRDVGCTHLLAPAGGVDSASPVTPACSTYNYGTVTANYLVSMKIGTLYNRTVSVIGQTPGTHTYVTFPNWIASPRGSIAVSCSTKLAADANPANDPQLGSVLVNVHDVGCSHLLVPAGNVDSASTAMPACSLYNYGTAEENYLVRMKIGSFYDQTASVSAHAAGTGIYVTFPVWSIQQARGAYVAVCSTELATDANPVNDFQTGNVTIATHDVGVVSILAPRDTVLQGSVTPQAGVHNYGSVPETFTVILRIDGPTPYDDSFNLSLPSGYDSVVSFPVWSATQGSYTVRCSTCLATDANYANDTLGNTFAVVRHDVGALSIQAPAGVLTPGPVVPRAAVHNYGSLSETFKAFIQIVGGVPWTDSLTVTLANGGDSVLDFQSWNATPGSYATRCSIYLATDADHSNDTVSNTFSVVGHDVAAVSIQAPSGTIMPGPVTPQATFHNYGSVTETFKVFILILGGAGWTDSLELTLASGGDTALSFSSWLAAPGSYTTRCSTFLAADINLDNDTVSNGFLVLSPDVGVVSIIGPRDTVLQGTVTPSAMVHNYSTETESFRVFFRISGAGSYADSTSATLAGGSDTTLSFASTSVAPGNYFTRCSTGLAIDVNPANDTLGGRFVVRARIPAGWTRVTDILQDSKRKNVKDGACLAYGTQTGNDSGFVFALKGNNTFEFYRYNVENNSWLARDPITAYGRSGRMKAVKKGSGLAFAGDGKLYAAKGNNTYDFWQYDPARPDGTHWVEMANEVPTGGRACREGLGMASATIAGTNYVYLLKGSGTYEFYRYNADAGTWETLPNAPAGASGKPFKNGSALTYDGGDTIYCVKGSYNEFFAYSISGRNWTTRDTLPRIAPPGSRKTKVKDGSGLAYDGRVVYALKGGNTNEFWAYYCNAHHWYVGDPMPTFSKKVKGGGGLTFGSSRCWAFRGNNTLEFWQYKSPLGDLMPLAQSPQGEGAQGSSAFSGSQFALSVLPNPFAGTAQVSYSVPQAGNVSMKLYDVTGALRSVLVQGYHRAGTSGFALRASDLPKGIYLLEYKSEGRIMTSKLIIE